MDSLLSWDFNKRLLNWGITTSPQVKRSSYKIQVVISMCTSTTTVIGLHTSSSHSISLTLTHSLTHSIPHSFAHLHTLTHYFLSLQLLIKRFGAVGCSYQVRSESQSKHIPWNLMNDNLCLPNNMRWHSCMPCGRNVHEMTCARTDMWVCICTCLPVDYILYTSTSELFMF